MTESTNLYYVVAQTLQWIRGLTSMEYNVCSSRIAKITHDDKTHYSFEVTTNGIRLGRIKHPMGLVVEEIHIVMTGNLVETPDWVELDEDGIAEIEITDMPKLLLHIDNSGFSNVGVQTKFKLFDGGENTISRHFMYKNNMLFQIR